MPGKKIPTTANSSTAFPFHPLKSAKNGALDQNTSAAIGMLNVAPSAGVMSRRPNWVTTSPSPNSDAEPRARAQASIGILRFSRQKQNWQQSWKQIWNRRFTRFGLPVRASGHPHLPHLHAAMAGYRPPASSHHPPGQSARAGCFPVGCRARKMPTPHCVRAEIGSSGPGSAWRGHAAARRRRQAAPNSGPLPTPSAPPDCSGW
jgi:hypothetical protein